MEPIRNLQFPSCIDMQVGTHKWREFVSAFESVEDLINAQKQRGDCMYLIGIGEFTKVGYSSSINSRIRTHNRNLKKMGLETNMCFIIDMAMFCGFAEQIEISIHNAIYETLVHFYPENMRGELVYDTETYPIDIVNCLQLVLFSISIKYNILIDSLIN